MEEVAFRKWVGRCSPLVLAVRVVVMLLVLCGNATLAVAADGSLPGTFSVTPQNGALLINAPYSGDDNSDNRLRLEWGIQGGDWGAATSMLLDHGPSPYRQSISGLSNYQSYQLRLTLEDLDGMVSGEAVQIFFNLVPYPPQIHSSLSTGSNKWPAGWGVPGGQYGEFQCNTCHERKSGNIKRIRKNIAVTDPLSTDHFPLQADSGTVLFSSVQPGNADFGDDSRSPATTSDHLCEACHTQTAYHNYDATQNSSGRMDHYNKANCIGCHRHQQGFQVSCEGCHTPQPSWPSHPAHLATDGLMTPPTCATCHQSAEHLNALSEVRFAGADSRVASAHYSDQGGDENSRYSEAGGYGATPAYGSCDTLYCHSNGVPFDGAIVYQTPTWGGAQLDCRSCHDGAAATTTLSGRHARHTDPDSYNYDCARCHVGTVSDAATVSVPSMHVNNVKDVSISGGGNYDTGTRVCTNNYCHGGGQVAQRNCNSAICHNDARTAPLSQAVAWSESAPLSCAACHLGRAGLDARNAQMNTNGHFRLANDHWIRQYPCEYCHAATVDATGEVIDNTLHANGTPDIVFIPKWSISGLPTASYDKETKVCLNLYCHSDGTTVDPEVRDFPWTQGTHASCNACHGHPAGECSTCHSDGRTHLPSEDQWKSAMPMYANSGPGTDRANSHLRHLQTDFSCSNCHALTVVGSCDTAGCHDGGVPDGDMTEVGHVNADKHVNNKHKDVDFKDGGQYYSDTKRCSSTACHGKSNPQWGESRENEIFCFTCHGTTEPDEDDFGAFNGIQAKINMTEWATTGHGRPAAAGNYPSGNAAVGNPPAAFPGNPCWYCHDQEVLHKDATNPYRLKKHPQFSQRFERECVYCHMEGTDTECRSCHIDAESLAPQASTIFPPTFSVDHRPFVAGGDSCSTATCHSDDAGRHKTGTGDWNAAQKEDVRNQYIMTGVCLQCHDNDDNGNCTQCHVWSGAPAENPYVLGYNPGPGFVSGSSKASSTHFGYKHMAKFEDNGTWGGGKFCWDCHDPHGDKNIYMIQNEVATETDGTFGIPLQRAAVTFTRTLSGTDYAKSMAPYNGICNVCHQSTDHYQDDHGDDHRSGRRCTECHEHGFGQGHASGQACNECHQSKPAVPHTGFGQARDCTQCHDGVINQRTDVMRQFKGQSHHVQGTEVNNRNCYACHWEATPEGLIDRDHHEGYNNKTHASVLNAPVDLVIWEAGKRPDVYTPSVTAVSFTANQIGTSGERSEVTKLTGHCLSCHSDQNNKTIPFDDCKTPNQYAWDGTSVGARYSQTGTTTLGKYNLTNTATKNQIKSFSAHGNAVANQGGWSVVNGEDNMTTNNRNGTQNVQCFDCHSSHGSYTTGTTSSYTTFDGSHGGANLKETQAGKGGYNVTYRAAAESNALSDLNPGAAQCFDCHETRTAGAKPWGFESTYGATAPIQGYRDSSRFDGGDTGVKDRMSFRGGKSGMSGHLSHLATPLEKSPNRQINGLCAGCHDPHGVSPTLGADQKYGVPLLKGTWLSSPYKEDNPQTNLATGISTSNVQIDRKTFNDVTNRNHITETPQQFAGLCLSCHPQTNLTEGMDKTQPWGSRDRVHQSVKGWGSNQEHQFPCAKCHEAHSSGLPRLMRTNCLDWNHRGNLESDGTTPTWRSETRHYPRLYDQYQPCHQSAGARGGIESSTNFKDQSWNMVTPW